MHFEEESEGEKETETIKELVEEEEEKVERISGAVSKKNLTKEAQAHTAKENPTNQAKDNQGKDNQYNQFKDNQFNQAKDNQYNQPKDNQYNQAKYSLSRKELFVEATDKKPEDVEEKVLQIREELKEKN